MKHSPKRLIASFVYEHFELSISIILEWFVFLHIACFCQMADWQALFQKVLFAANGLSVQLECYNRVQFLSIFCCLLIYVSKIYIFIKDWEPLFRGKIKNAGIYFCRFIDSLEQVTLYLRGDMDIHLGCIFDNLQWRF